MKKILYVLTAIVLLNSCDDGDLTVENIDFEEVTAAKCSNKDVIYKIKDSEILLLSIPESTFIEDETPENEPITLTINATNQVKYRQYSSEASSDNICPTIPDATPSLVEEWNAISGTIEITSRAIKTTDSETNATKITGYRHYIVLRNVTFDKPNGTQSYTEFVFGNYNKNVVSSLPFGFDENAEKSSCDNRIFNINGSESMILNVTDFNTLFENNSTTTPRIALINSSNTLTYRLFNNVVTDSYFCTSPTPTTPTLVQEWTAVDGISNSSGIIEITTEIVPTSQGDGYKHTIHLKNTTLQRGNSSFYLGDDFLLGSFTIVP